ncbi:Sulfate/thiosulfate import ATP-binding protein CysA [Aggregatibacter actinomycetemcomitans]|uniref:molybdenum ABC transporter ATP-binding protein ModC n=1 Tax=Aggregatibacter actinomycetemcomitans TaxID=714 RepID=UPI0001B9F88B|nr:molybdenum ABC transporter ATP-binding protein ModC [Aggregatibacter actinomycetemcomitans]ACX82488.1 molybdenum ABC transporter ATP-binding protein [Aggregatibacter actinomycetemcomitans D11S-1]AHN72052.1 molybdenum ABC transporter, ATP-binding protein,putative' [Aggregatibacter actinomycetemcomitans HK1651]KOE57805.1 molybdenum ABC transporter ATP-binding protein [Aggregatibacter actinomycetemcomitans serotype c str. AAS4A]KOE60043.1 molybdenum ABC transporter ATP-binding protein [Aggregat
MLYIDVKKQLGNLSLQAKLEIPSQGVTALFGLSGSGKSSLINLISGLINPDEGVIALNDRVLFEAEEGICVPANRRNIGYVFQDARLFPHYTVKGNLRYGMKNTSKDEFDYIVELLGIGHLLKRYPITLSGGEKQRVAIGRALLTDPEILLMDEPLSALDLPRKRELLNYLERLSKEINIPILYVTHSIDELLRLPERVVLLTDGKVEAYDMLENIWESPLFLPWKQENEQSAVLSLPVFMHNPSYKMTALSIGDQNIWINQVASEMNENVRICVHSSDVSISLHKAEKSSIRNILHGRIVKIQEQENRVDLKLDIGGKHIWASISKWSFHDLALQPGQLVYAQIKAISVLSA